MIDGGGIAFYVTVLTTLIGAALFLVSQTISIVTKYQKFKNKIDGLEEDGDTIKSLIKDVLVELKDTNSVIVEYRLKNNKMEQRVIVLEEGVREIKAVIYNDKKS